MWEKGELKQKKKEIKTKAGIRKSIHYYTYKKDIRLITEKTTQFFTPELYYTYAIFMINSNNIKGFLDANFVKCGVKFYSEINIKW